MKIRNINEQEWNELAAACPYSGPFHDYGWGKLTSQVLGGEFKPLEVIDGASTWLVPCYIGRPWAGPGEVRIGSVGYGGPLAIHEVKNPAHELQNVRAVLKHLATRFGADRVNATLYPAGFWNEVTDDGSVAENSGTTCRVPLPKTPHILFEKIVTGNVRTAIRKSAKEGVIVREINSSDEKEMKSAQQLLCQTQRAVGSSYETPYEFFAALAEDRLDSAGTRVFIAIHDEKIVGVASLVFDKHEAFNLFHGWDRSAAKVCANQALLWHMMSVSIKHGSAVFNMGESHTEALLQAKLRWGGHLERVPRLHWPAQD